MAKTQAQDQHHEPQEPTSQEPTSQEPSAVDEWPEVRLRELSDEDCWELVSQPGHIGRVAWNSGSGPVALPVNYMVYERHLWIRTSAYSSLTREIDDNLIAVEIDDIDPATHLGWSVLIRGMAEVKYHPEEVPGPVLEHRTWPAGHRPLWVPVSPRAHTGPRRVSA